jgi:hypothetical protein
MFHLLVDPLRELALSEEERLLLSVIVVFSIPVLEMSEEGAEILAWVRKRHLDVLHRYIVNSYNGVDADLYASVRMGNLLVLLSSVTVGYDFLSLYLAR